MRYTAFAYRQVALGPIILSFIGTSCEIERWAKVPTKLASTPRNFQRAELPKHVDEIRDFFNDPSSVNSSPTSIVLGIDPAFQTRVRICETRSDNSLSIDSISTTPVLCDLVIDFDPWDSSQFSGENDLDQEIESLFAIVRQNYESRGNASDSVVDEVDGDEEQESFDDPDSDDDLEGLDADDELDRDVETGELEPLTAEHGTSSPPENLNNLAQIASKAERAKDTRKFLAGLTAKRIFHLMTDRLYRDLPKHRKEGLRDLFKDELKPGLIIDGQHRVMGTANRGEIPFSVLLLPFASWGELAFQFIINNGTAKKVDEGLLISIVGESLTPADLAETDSRLNRAGVNVRLIQAVMLVQKSENPFAGMLNFDVPGELGFLDSKAMKSKVVELWWGTRGKTGQRPNTRKFKVHDHREWDMFELFGNSTKGRSREEKVRNWQDSNKWFEYFRSFWEAISEHFKPRLWPPAVSEWLPSSARPATPEQQEREKLMRVTVLGLLQTAVLQVWADNTNRQLTLDGKSMTDFRVSPGKFRTEIANLIRIIPHDFFTELKYTGFDASSDLRQDFVGQIVALLELRKTFAAIRSSHRFWQGS